MNEKIKEKIHLYPKDAKVVFISLRKLLFSVAKERELGEVEEDLKWGEPSYKTISGSPVRIAWKENKPDQISLFFNCNTSLVETFREIYTDSLQFEGNREIVVPISEPFPEPELTHCLFMALNYHKLKKLPLLGA